MTAEMLTQLFDFQMFEGNRELQRVIDSVHDGSGVWEMSMEDLETVAAAGMPAVPGKNGKQ